MHDREKKRKKNKPHDFSDALKCSFWLLCGVRSVRLGMELIGSNCNNTHET